MPKNLACISCNHESLYEIGDPGLGGVTSDEKAWPHVGALRVCAACGHVQKLLDECWREAVGRIYADYDIYHISGGVEKLQYEAATTQPRSAQLVRRLQEEVGLPASGSMLDVGCGMGAFLRAFSKLPGWALAGAEQDNRCERVVRAINGVQNFYAHGFEDVEDRFDLISLLHVLEHIPNPQAFLKRLGEKLTPGGLIFCQVPYFPENPFDLVITDHCSHFVPAQAAAMARRLGFEVAALSTSWAVKELSLVLRRAQESPSQSARVPDAAQVTPAAMLAKVEQSLVWLRELLDDARGRARGTFGVLGTSIAGTWMWSALRDHFDFFVEEDPARIGRVHLGMPILHPAQTPAGSRVYLGFGRALAERIHERLSSIYPHLEFLLPPAPPSERTALRRAA